VNSKASKERGFDHAVNNPKKDQDFIPEGIPARNQMARAGFLLPIYFCSVRINAITSLICASVSLPV
jgi:hypothetical protein